MPFDEATERDFRAMEKEVLAMRVLLMKLLAMTAEAQQTGISPQMWNQPTRTRALAAVKERAMADSPRS
jgi:hypothetical protein